MFRRNEIVEEVAADPRNSFLVRVLGRCPVPGNEEWWRVKEIPDTPERAAELKRCAMMGYRAMLVHQSQLRKISNR